MMDRLTPDEVLAPAKTGRLSDGGNLYLAVTPDGGRYWRFMYRWDGKQIEASLGPVNVARPADNASVADRNRAKKLAKESLDGARAKAREGRQMLDQKPPVNPAAVWRKLPESGSPRFQQAAADYIASKKRWSESHRASWLYTVRDYCKPLHRLCCNEITTNDVLKALRPLWERAPETASRLRQRIETVIEFARLEGDHTLNPARWKDWLERKLDKDQLKYRVSQRGADKGRLVPRENHLSLSCDEVPSFVAALRADDARALGVAPLALEFTLLTAARAGEVRLMTWDEVDFDEKLWTLSPARMKKRREHQVPLSDRALDILREMRSLTRGDYVFGGRFDKTPISETAFPDALGRIGFASRTSTHGMRATFRSWCQKAKVDFEVAERCLAHTVGTATQRAYARDVLLEERREALERWAAYCEPSGGPQATESDAANIGPDIAQTRLTTALMTKKRRPPGSGLVVTKVQPVHDIYTGMLARRGYLAILDEALSDAWSALHGRNSKLGAMARAVIEADKALVIAARDARPLGIHAPTQEVLFACLRLARFGAVASYQAGAKEYWARERTQKGREKKLERRAPAVKARLAAEMALLKEHGLGIEALNDVKAPWIAEQLGVSEATVRRDYRRHAPRKE
jgi:integrase